MNNANYSRSVAGKTRRALQKVLTTKYYCREEFKYFSEYSDKEQLEIRRGRAQRYFHENYSVEQRYLISLSQDLNNGYQAIKNLGIEKARTFQFYFDFILNFEELREKMTEFRWSPEFMKRNGIDYQKLRKLYFAVN